MNTTTNTMTKDNVIGQALMAIDDSKAFENLSLNGRYTQVHREEFKVLSQKYSDQANHWMNLAYRWADEVVN